MASDALPGGTHGLDAESNRLLFRERVSLLHTAQSLAAKCA